MCLCADYIDGSPNPAVASQKVWNLINRLRFQTYVDGDPTTAASIEQGSKDQCLAEFWPVDRGPHRVLEVVPLGGRR